MKVKDVPVGSLFEIAQTTGDKCQYIKLTQSHLNNYNVVNCQTWQPTYIDPETNILWDCELGRVPASNVQVQFMYGNTSWEEIRELEEFLYELAHSKDSVKAGKLLSFIGRIKHAVVEDRMASKIDVYGT
jgi:hypothetical protein